MVRIAAALCFLAVALGAFGAHWLKPTLEANGLVDVWNKAVLYHFIHAIALFVLALYGSSNRGAWWLLFVGILLFSGSLYVMALTNVRWLGAITPLGGLCFLAGWAWLVISPTRYGRLIRSLPAQSPSRAFPSMSFGSRRLHSPNRSEPDWHLRAIEVNRPYQRW